MKILLHHIKNEYKLNSKSLWFGIALIYLLLFITFDDFSGQKLGIESVGACFLFGIFMSSAYKREFSMKYFMALPIPRDLMVILMVFGRIIYFVPGAIVLTSIYSQIAKHDYLNYSWVSFITCYFLAGCIFNAIQVNSDIDQPRLETVTSRFEAFLMFIKKVYLNIVLSAFISVVGFLILLSIVEMIGLKFLANQFLLSIYAAGILYYLIKRCHKVLLNERLSYWSWKKDGSVVFAVLVLMIAPAYLLDSSVFSKRFSKFFKDPSPYFEAVTNNDIEVIKSLHAQGIKADEQNVFGATPALHAIKLGHVLALKELENIGAGADASKLYKNKGHLNRNVSLDELESKSEEFAKSEGEKVTAAHLAIESGNPEMLMYVMQLPGINEALSQKEVKTPLLFYAAQKCEPEIINLLIQSGSDPNQRLADYSTPLMAAKCLPAMVELLLNGADPSLKDQSGKTAFDRGSRQVKFILERLSGKKMTKDRAPASTNLDFPNPKR